MSESDEQLFEQLGQNIFSSSLMNDNTVPLDLRQLNIYGNLDDDDEVMDEDDDNNTTSQDKFFYASNYTSRDRRLFEGFLHNFPSSDSSSTTTNRLNSLSINVNPWGDHKSADAQENEQQQQQPPQLINSNTEDPFLDNFQAKTGTSSGTGTTENDDGFQFANFADFDKFCDNNFSSSLGGEDKNKDEVFMTEVNSDRNANIENISTKDTNVEAPVTDVAAADTPSNAAFPSANNISNDDTLDLDGSDGLLNGSYEDSEENIESNFNM